MTAAIGAAIAMLGAAISVLSAAILVPGAVFQAIAMLVKLHRCVTELFILVIRVFFPDLGPGQTTPTIAVASVSVTPSNNELLQYSQ